MESNNQAIKKNLSSLQVLHTLKVLMEDNYTMQNLIKKLNSNDYGVIYNNSIVSKYINTCRYCGIDIPKIHNKYFVASLPFGLNLNSNDINLIKELQQVIKTQMSIKSGKQIDSFIDKLNKFSNKYITKIEQKTIQYAIQLFEKALKEKRKIRLMFKVKLDMDCIPVNISENIDGKTVFNVIDNGMSKSISISKLSGLEILDEKFIYNRNDDNVIFLLSGNLAERYSLRECETVLERHSKYIVISNQGEDKDELLSRLLRYDTCCEVVSPAWFRNNIIGTINATLTNYGVK